ncbi:HupE/UreJ family protein [Hyphomicrobium sp.]|uniref:HupE/UreJ family protein n=1 Tax=Hyphomicrobium sp. TaxID=82 RepID=UPI003F6F2BDA
MLHRSLIKPALAGFLIALTSGQASAHVGHGEVEGLMHGFLHPIGGLDHMLAMVAVGLLAALLGGRALWMVPAAFLAMMAAGAGLAMAGFALPFVELGISASVVALGVAVAFQLPLPVIAAMGIAGFFAVFHGAAHGAEMPVDASGASYAAGFLAATALLHLAGIGVGVALSRLVSNRDAMRLAGGAIAVAGLYLAV